jgi:hypothetical protein
LRAKPESGLLVLLRRASWEISQRLGAPGQVPGWPPPPDDDGTASEEDQQEQEAQ